MPSANKSFNVSPVDSKDVFDEFKKKIKIIVNGGKCKVGIESTVIDLTNKPKILRPGIISLSDIEKTLKIKLNNNSNKSKFKSPGMLKKHYSPGIPIKLNSNKSDYKAAFIVFGKQYKKRKDMFNLSKKSNLNVKTEDWRIAKTVFVADDLNTAKEYALGPNSPYVFYFKQLFKKFVALGKLDLFKTSIDQPDKEITLETVCEKLIIWGTPEKVVDDLSAFKDQVGEYGMLMYAGVDWLDPAIAKKSMTLMAEKVNPYL